MKSYQDLNLRASYIIALFSILLLDEYIGVQSLYFFHFLIVQLGQILFIYHWLIENSIHFENDF